MILHENVEIMVETDSFDYITITNKRSDLQIRITIAGRDMLIDPDKHKTSISSKGIVIIEGEGYVNY